MQHLRRLFLIVADLIKILFLLAGSSMQIWVGIELFWCVWNGPWGILFLLLAKLADFLGVLLVHLVDIVHYRGDALEVGNKLFLRYLFAGVSRLLSGVFLRLLNVHWHLDWSCLQGLARTAAAALHLLVIGLSSDVAED